MSGPAVATGGGSGPATRHTPAGGARRTAHWTDGRMTLRRAPQTTRGRLHARRPRAPPAPREEARGRVQGCRRTPTCRPGVGTRGNSEHHLQIRPHTRRPWPLCTEAGPGDGCASIRAPGAGRREAGSRRGDPETRRGGGRPRATTGHGGPTCQCCTALAARAGPRGLPASVKGLGTPRYRGGLGQQATRCSLLGAHGRRVLGMAQHRAAPVPAAAMPMPMPMPPRCRAAALLPRLAPGG